MKTIEYLISLFVTSVIVILSLIFINTILLWVLFNIILSTLLWWLFSQVLIIKFFDLMAIMTVGILILYAYSVHETRPKF